MAQSHAAIYVHLVFATRGRAPMIVAEHRDEFHRVIGGLVSRSESHSLGVGGTADHVHVLLRLSRRSAMADVAREVKSLSSGWMRERQSAFAWQSGYGAFSFSVRDLPVLQAYVASQEEHHRRVGFREEYVELLRNHGIEPDEFFLGTWSD